MSKREQSQSQYIRFYPLSILMKKFLQFLWILPPDPVVKHKSFDLPEVKEDMIKVPEKVQFHHQPWFMEDLQKEKKRMMQEATDKEFEREEKKRRVWTGNLMDMIDGYDRHKGRFLIKKYEKPIKERDPKDRFRGDIDKIVEESERKMKEKKEKQIAREERARWKRYIKNVDEVLSHNSKPWENKSSD